MLGSNLVRELLRRKHHVRVLVRKNSNLRSIKNLNIELYEGDITDLNSFYEGCKGYDYVIHAAAKTPGQSIHYTNYIETNVKGTQNKHEIFIFLHFQSLLRLKMAAHPCVARKP